MEYIHEQAFKAVCFKNA